MDRATSELAPLARRQLGRVAGAAEALARRAGANSERTLDRLGVQRPHRYAGVEQRDQQHVREEPAREKAAAQQVFAEMFDTGKAPAAIVQEKGLAQVSDTGAIEKFCDEIIAANPGPANDFKSGKAAWKDAGHPLIT